MVPQKLLCTNTFGAINDMNEFVNALADLMDGNSIFIYENPYLLDTFKGLQFELVLRAYILFFGITNV